MYFTNITHYFDVAAQKYPNRIAVYEGDNSITLADLRSRCLTIGQAIFSQLQGHSNQIIAVYLPKSIESVATDIGIIYSGNAYMNLDIKNPAQRICNILTLIRPSLIITTKVLAQHLEEVSGSVPVLTLEEVGVSITENDEKNLLDNRASIIDTDPMCIINTSGSTGTPKGVVLNHCSFIDFLECVVEAGLVNDDEVVASLSPLVFDIYSFELCMLMAKASTIILIPDSLASFPVRMLELMSQRKVSFLFWVPTIMVNIANMDLLTKLPLPDLKMAWFAGEVFPTSKFNYWRKNLPQTTFANFYGPIEITLDCVYYVVSRELADDEPIPIGKPFKNTDILILDENNESVQPGEEGELCVRGSSLALGYYNDPEKTAEAFVQNPLNISYPELIYRTGDVVHTNDYGEMVFRGRKDTLIKHLGYRIELAEIEHVVIDTLQTVKNCCAVHNSVEKKIVMFYESCEPLGEKALRQSLGGVLPRYMVPAAYIHMRELPRNTNGKIDRSLLQEMIVSQ